MSTKDLSENSHSYLLVELRETERQEYHCCNTNTNTNTNTNNKNNNNNNLMLIWHLIFATL